MSERSEDSFDIEDDFNSDSNDESRDLDRLIVVEKRPKPTRNGKAPVQQAAWSRVEDMLEKRRLERELKEFLDGEEA